MGGEKTNNNQSLTHFIDNIYTSHFFTFFFVTTPKKRNHFCNTPENGHFLGDVMANNARTSAAEGPSWCYIFL